MTGRMILVGGGAFGRELINWAEDAAAAGHGCRFDSFLDQSAAALDGFAYKLGYLGTIEDYKPAAEDKCVLAIGDPVAKRTVVEKLKAKGASFASLIHPSAVVARTAVLGEGVVVCPHAMISADCVVGDFVAINGMCSVGHDVRIGAYSTLSAQVDLTGWVQIGEAVFFGSGARVLPKTRVGDEARIGAGAIIMRTVAPGAVMYANPARKL